MPFSHFFKGTTNEDWNLNEVTYKGRINYMNMDIFVSKKEIEANTPGMRLVKCSDTEYTYLMPIFPRNEYTDMIFGDSKAVKAREWAEKRVMQLKPDENDKFNIKNMLLMYKKLFKNIQEQTEIEIWCYVDLLITKKEREIKEYREKQLKEMPF